MHAFFVATVYQPLYNGVIFFISLMPGANVGLAVISFTLLIKLILFPLSQKSVQTQFAMKAIEPELAEIKTKYKDSPQEQAKAVMQVYKDRNINPFSGILLLLIQFPILAALYFIFARGGLPHIDMTLVYPFIHAAANMNLDFLGTSVADKSTIFAILAGITQFLQMQFVMPKAPPRAQGADVSFKDELSRSMSVQAKYVMPFIMFLIARSFPAVVSLYLITSSIFAVGQELYVRRNYRKPIAA